MPIKIPEAAGDPYRPSNGTEGMMFKDIFCERCKLNTFDFQTGAGGCDIELRSMCHNIGDAEYPTEWVFDAEGCPTCTAFEERTK